MPTYNLLGVEVEFPFEAYPCQLDYMGKVIESLKGRKNALLESPTGTGKTLCLLCATLAWRRNMEQTLQASFSAAQPLMSQGAVRPPMMNAPPHMRPPQAANQGPAGQPAGGAPQPVNVKHMLPTIIYSSRTHSQLVQVMRELKRTSYKVAGSVVGSRQQLCLHPTVSKMSSGAANTACRTFVAGGQCEWHHRSSNQRSNTSSFLEKNPHVAEAILDIEELGKLGRSRRICPYFLSRDISTNADIIFMPYNYLLDARNRQGLNDHVKWNGAILIFDEAHNVESVCADSASIELSAVQVGQALSEVGRAKEYCRERTIADGSNAALPALHPNGEPVLYRDLSEKFTMFASVLKSMEDSMASWALTLPPTGKTSPGDELYTWLQSFKINEDTLPLLHKVMEEVLSVLNDKESGEFTAASKSPGAGLQCINDLLTVAMNAKQPMRVGGPPAHKGYRLHMHMERPEGAVMVRGAKVNREPIPKLSYWCFIPGIAMMALQAMDIHCMILTSGTLAPLDSFAHELQIPFPIRLENPHVITPSQIWVGVMSNGPTGHQLCSSYQSRSDPRYKTDLGLTILNVARVTPDGLLVFFPSYVVLNACLEHWKNDGEIGATIWDRICRYKQPVVEPRDTRLFAGVFKEFMDKLNEPLSTGAVFFAVCRGKVSEGLDFSDRAARAVVITGIPFANKTDPKVCIKQQVLDEEHRAAMSNKRQSSGTLTGDQWYVQQATRAVNQAIGRVIRHRDDFGAVVLADSRFGSASSKNNLSKWLRDHVQVYPQFGPASSAFTKFFKGKEQLTLEARERALSAAPAQSGPVFQVTGGNKPTGMKGGVRNFLDKNMVPAAMDVSGLPAVPRGLAASIGNRSTTNHLLAMLNDAANHQQATVSKGSFGNNPGSSDEPARFSGHRKDPQQVAGGTQLGGLNTASKGVMAEILGELSAPAAKRQKLDTTLGGRTMPPLGAPTARKPFIPSGHHVEAASNVIGPAHLVKEHQQRMAQQMPVPSNAPQQTGSGAVKPTPSTTHPQCAVVPGTAPTGSKVEVGRCAPISGGIAGSQGKNEQREKVVGREEQRGGAQESANDHKVAGREDQHAGAQGSKAKVDPKQFYANIEKELTAEQAMEFKGLLKRYRETKGAGQETFIEGLVSLLKGPATAHLLPQFEPQLKRDLRDWFRNLIKPYTDNASKHMNSNAASSHHTGALNSATSASNHQGCHEQPAQAKHVAESVAGLQNNGKLQHTRTGDVAIVSSKPDRQGLYPGRENKKKHHGNADTPLLHKPVVLLPTRPGQRHQTPQLSKTAPSLKPLPAANLNGSKAKSGQAVEQEKVGKSTTTNKGNAGPGLGTSIQGIHLKEKEPRRDVGTVKGSSVGLATNGKTRAEQGDATVPSTKRHAPTKAAVEKVSTPQDTSCVICQKPRCEPNAWQAQCGHMACYPCWLARLKSRPSCPACNKKANRSELTMVPFA